MSIRSTTIEVRELNEAVARLLKCPRDPKEGHEAREELDRKRAEIRRRMGTVDADIELVRDARNP